MTRPSTSPWSDDRVELCRQLYVEQGLSASAVAEQLGDWCNRNMVIGVGHRHHWDRSPAIGIANSIRAAAKIKAAKLRAPPRPKRPLKLVASEPSMAEPIPFALTGKHVCLFCVEPENEPAHSMMLVCGAPTEAGRSYCLPHLRRTFSIAEQRKAGAVDVQARMRA